MRFFLGLSCLVLATSAFGQGHNTNDSSDKVKALGFLVGSWKGKENFQMGNGTTMSADIALTDTSEVGGRYIQERSATTLANGRTSHVIHMIGYDLKKKVYMAWWFNDTSSVPMELEGSFDGPNLILETPEGANGPTFKATYTKADSGFKYKLELKQPDGWRTLFSSDYSRT